jgi:hypothetical protein
MNLNSAVALGQGGSIVRSTPNISITPDTGRFWKIIQVISDVKFAILTNNGAVTGSEALANLSTPSLAITIPAGTCLYGNFTEIRLHSGVVIAYFGI